MPQSEPLAAVIGINRNVTEEFLTMKYFILFSIAVLLAGCIGSSTAFTNRSVTYLYTPSIDGKSNAITEQPKTNDSTVNAEKTTETKSNLSGTGDVTDSSSNQQAKANSKESDK